MNISTIKIAFKYLFGGVSGVVEYLLGVLNAALAGMTEANRQRVQGALNLSQKVLATLTALKWLCPTKWQTAYKATVDAVAEAVAALEDLELTTDEVSVVADRVKAALDAWKQPDDETCADCAA